MMQQSAMLTICPKMARMSIQSVTMGRVQTKTTAATAAKNALPSRRARMNAMGFSSAPGVDVGQEELEPLGGELLVHKLLAVAVSPQDVPAFARHRTWQGFAPFGSSLLR